MKRPENGDVYLIKANIRETSVIIISEVLFFYTSPVLFSSPDINVFFPYFDFINKLVLYLLLGLIQNTNKKGPGRGLLFVQN
jgi:hypothetical protein